MDSSKERPVRCHLCDLERGTCISIVELIEDYRCQIRKEVNPVTIVKGRVSILASRFSLEWLNSIDGASPSLPICHSFSLVNKEVSEASRRALRYWWRPPIEI